MRRMSQAGVGERVAWERRASGLCLCHSHLHWALAPPEKVAGNVGFRVLLPDSDSASHGWS